jgi:hypothetical protein
VLGGAATLLMSSWRAHVEAGLGLLDAAIRHLAQHGALLSEQDLEVTASLSSQAGRSLSQPSSSRATAMQVLQANPFARVLLDLFDSTHLKDVVW